MLYLILGHRIATNRCDTISCDTISCGTDRAGGQTRSGPMSGIDQLGAAMLIAALAAMPFGIVQAAPAFAHPTWLAWGIGVGLCSSVIPYVTDQLAMARLPRATFALMLALLPAAATVIGLVVLGQVPTVRDLSGVALVITGLAVHRDSTPRPAPTRSVPPDCDPGRQ